MNGQRNTTKTALSLSCTTVRIIIPIITSESHTVTGPPYANGSPHIGASCQLQLKSSRQLTAAHRPCVEQSIEGHNCTI